jgi:ElaB/YqjD/DUF883 family membrane-anchored ribosome-binding protein
MIKSGGFCMKYLAGLMMTAALLAGSAGMGLAQDSNKTVKQHAKDAAHDTKEAAKSTGKAVKKGTKKAVNKTARATRKGAGKVEQKTQ